MCKYVYCFLLSRLREATSNREEGTSKGGEPAGQEEETAVAENKRKEGISKEGESADQEEETAAA